MNAGGLSRKLLQTACRPLLLVWCIPLVSSGADWPSYRGPNHDGVSTDRITRQWIGTVTNPVWRVLLTNGLSSLTVSGGRVFTQMWRTIGGVPTEVCLALNSATGMELWATPVDDALYPTGGVGPDDGPRTTPVVEGGSVFVLGSYLKLYRLNATNGAVIWQKDLRTIYGGNVTAHQNAASPLLEGGLIFVNANCTTSTLMALRTSDGSLAWRTLNERLTHSTPVLATIHGMRQVIFVTQNALVSLAPSSGNLLWRFYTPFSYTGSLAISPVVYEDMVFYGGAHAYGMGSVVIRASLSGATWTTTQLWYTNNPASHWMTPIAHEGFLYGQFGIQSSFDSPRAQLKCVNMQTGAVKWSTNNFGRGGTIFVDNHILSLTESNELVLVKPDTNAYTEVARFRAVPNPSQSTNRCWNVPAVCDGRVYVRSTSFASAFDFSVPDLKLDVPEPIGADKLKLTIRTVNNSPLDSNRMAGLGVRASTNLVQSLAQWVPLTNSPVLTNGAVRFDDVERGPSPQRFFIVREPE